MLTAGNAQSSSFGFKNDYLQKWAKARFELKAVAININTGTTVYTLTQADNDAGFTLSDDTVSSTTAESYFLGGRFDRDLAVEALASAHNLDHQVDQLVAYGESHRRRCTGHQTDQ